MKWKEVVHLLRIDEYKRLVDLELAWDMEYWKQVKNIVSQSKEMIELFKYQEDYFPEK